MWFQFEGPQKMFTPVGVTTTCREIEVNGGGFGGGAQCESVTIKSSSSSSADIVEGMVRSCPDAPTNR